MRDMSCTRSRESMGEEEREEEETGKGVSSDLWKALVVKLRNLCFLQLTKKSHAHDRLESGLSEESSHG